MAKNTETFHFVGQVKVGTLSPTLKTEWDRLYRAQIDLLRLQEEHEVALDAFWEGLQREFGAQVPKHEVTQVFRVSPDGEVFVEHCACATCQAVINNTTVAKAMAQMYSNGAVAQEATNVTALSLDAYPLRRKKISN